MWNSLIEELKYDKANLLAAYEQLWEAGEALAAESERHENEVRARLRLEQAMQHMASGLPGAVYLVNDRRVQPLNAAARDSIGGPTDTTAGALEKEIAAAVAGQNAAYEITCIDPHRHIVVSLDTSELLHSRIQKRAQAWKLTPRQTEVLAGLVRGLSNKELALDLGCSLKTVESYLTGLFRRAQVDSRLALIAGFWSAR